MTTLCTTLPSLPITKSITSTQMVKPKRGNNVRKKPTTPLWRSYKGDKKRNAWNKTLFHHTSPFNVKEKPPLLRLLYKCRW